MTTTDIDRDKGQSVRGSVQPGQRVLVLTPFGADASIVCGVLADSGVRAVPCLSLDELCGQLEEGAATILLAEEALTDEARARISAALADEPTWSDLPLLLITSHVRNRENLWCLLEGLRGTVHVTLLERPLHVATLVSAVRVAIEARKRQYQVRDELIARRHAEEALRDSEHRYRALFDSIDEGFCIVKMIFDDDGKPADYRFLQVNPAFAKLTGFPDAEGKRLRELIPTHYQKWIDIYGQIALTGQPTRFEEYEKDLQCWYDIYAFRFGSPAEHQVAILFSDISDRKRAEEALKLLNERLEQQVARRTAQSRQRAEALRRLAAELSQAEHRERKRLGKLLHDDLQQLLLAVQLRLPALLESPPDTLPQQVERLEELVSECVSTSRDLSHELSPSVLHKGTLVEAIEWLGEWFGKKHGLSVTVKAQDGLPALPEHLRVFYFQAVRELLSNVIKHSSQMEAWVNASRDDESMCLEVEDHGKHFNPHLVRKHLADAEGYGLFNIHERLEALKGQLEIRGRKEGGACFRLRVPLAECVEPTALRETEEKSPLTKKDLPPSPAQPQATRLLIVDDHAVVRHGFIGLLSRQPDFQVVGQAADGSEAIRQTELLHPDTIIMDVDMPKIGGVQATEAIKKRWPHIQIIGLSLHEEEGVARAMLAAGADAHLSKHAPARELIAAIRRVCGGDAKTGPSPPRT